MILDVGQKLAAVTAALRVAVEALRLNGLEAPHEEGLKALSVLTEDDQANLENTDLYEVAEIEAELRTWGAVDGDRTWWLLARVERSLLEELAGEGGDGSHPLPSERLEAAERTRERAAGWARASQPFLAGYAAGYAAERERGDRLDREAASLRAALAAAGEPRFDAPVPYPANLDAMAEALSLHGDSDDVRCVEGLGLSVGTLTELLARSEAWGRVLDRRLATADRDARQGQAPPLDDTTRLLLQDLRFHVVRAVGTERAARIMPMVGSYMAHAAAGWGPLDGDGTPSGS